MAPKHTSKVLPYLILSKKRITLFNPNKPSVYADTAMEDAAMNNIPSQASLESAMGGSGTINPLTENEMSSSQAKNLEEEDMVDFKSQDFNVPPLFGCNLSEENLKNDVWPYVLWAMLKIPLPKITSWAADATFDCLADFIEVASKVDKKFVVFPYSLSNYKLFSNLPPGVADLEGLPETIEDWLQYFPQAKPRAKGGNVYMALLNMPLFCVH